MGPLTLSLLAGGTSFLGNLFEGFGANSAAKEQNRLLKQQIAKNEQDAKENRDRLINENKSLSTDFLSNYVAIKDAERASGLKSEYDRNKVDLSTSLSRIDAEKNALNSQLTSQMQGTRSNASIVGSGLMQGLGQGLAAYGSGKQMQAANELLSGMKGSAAVNSNQFDFNKGIKIGSESNGFKPTFGLKTNPYEEDIRNKWYPYNNNSLS